MPEAENAAETAPGLSNDEKKFLMKALWSALLVPKWTKDDLVELGTAIFKKKSLKEMDDEVFDKIFPFLEEITVALGESLANAAPTAPAEKKPEDKKTGESDSKPAEAASE